MSEPLPALLCPAGNGSTVGPGGAPAADAGIDLVPAPVWSSGLSADRIGPVQWRSVSGLRPYAPHFIEIPSFRGSPSWQMLRQLLKESGVRDPLLVLPDGRVVDGVHRLELARALGLSEVPVRVVDLPENCSVSDRMQLETTRAALDAGRRRIGPPDLRRLVLELTQAEVRLRVVNQRVANLRRGPIAGSGPAVPTQRERGQAVGMSERAVRRLDRIAREAPPDVLDAVRAGTLSPKAADRRLARRRASHVPTGPVRARETGDGRVQGACEEILTTADQPRGSAAALRSVELHSGPGSMTPECDADSGRRGAVPAQPPVIGERPEDDPPDRPTLSPSSIPPAVEAFMVACRALEGATGDFLEETAHWTGERREQRTLTIWQGIRQLEEHLDWMETAGEVQPAET